MVTFCLYVSLAAFDLSKTSNEDVDIPSSPSMGTEVNASYLHSGKGTVTSPISGRFPLFFQTDHPEGFSTLLGREGILIDNNIKQGTPVCYGLTSNLSMIPWTGEILSLQV